MAAVPLIGEIEISDASEVIRATNTVDLSQDVSVSATATVCRSMLDLDDPMLSDA